MPIPCDHPAWSPLALLGVTMPDGHPEQREGSGATRSDSALRLP
jgi:hypothetical protein